MIVILGSTPVRLFRNSVLVDRSDGINECSVPLLLAICLSHRRYFGQFAFLYIYIYFN